MQQWITQRTAPQCPAGADWRHRFDVQRLWRSRGTYDWGRWNRQTVSM